MYAKNIIIMSLGCEGLGRLGGIVLNISFRKLTYYFQFSVLIC